MEKIVEQTLLYDFYGELLTEHQKKIYEDVVLNDLSLSEIAEELGISRQGVHDMVRRCNKILSGYEDKLHLLEKFIKTKERITCIRDYAKGISQTDDTDVISDMVDKIERLSNEIIEEF